MEESIRNEGNVYRHSFINILYVGHVHIHGSKAVVPVLVLHFVALWFILRGDLFYVLPCVILSLCFSVLLALRLPRLGKIELIFVLFVRLFDLYLFGFVGLVFLLVSGKGCGLWLWHSQDFSLTLFYNVHIHSFINLQYPGAYLQIRGGIQIIIFIFLQENICCDTH